MYKESLDVVVGVVGDWKCEHEQGCEFAPAK
jgi:hypothetical protein